MSEYRHREGETLGKWELLAPLGRGGFSEVWRAVEVQRPARGMSPIVTNSAAVKILTNAEHVASLAEEAASLGVVRGEGIVRTYEVALDHDPPYLALELLTGGDLRARLAKEGGRLPPHAALQLVERLLEILVRVHREGIVHGDLKPENVLFVSKGADLRLADFGLSRRIAQRTATLSVSLSLADARIAGTLDYMAPEQREGEKPTPRSDVYAVGVILHELLFGERPQGISGSASDRDPRLPPLVDRVLAYALALDPRDRCKDAGELLKVLRDGLWLDARALRTANVALHERDSLATGVPLVWAISTVCVGGLALVGGLDAEGQQHVQQSWWGAGVIALLATAAPLVPLLPVYLDWKRRVLDELAKVNAQLATIQAWRELSPREQPRGWARAVARKKETERSFVARTRRRWVRVRVFWRWLRRRVLSRPA